MVSGGSDGALAETAASGGGADEAAVIGVDVAGPAAADMR